MLTNRDSLIRGCCVFGLVLGGGGLFANGEIVITDADGDPPIAAFFESPGVSGFAGKRVAALEFDLDGEGRNDFIVGAPHVDSSGSASSPDYETDDAGRVYVVSGDDGSVLLEFTHSAPGILGVGVDNLGTRPDPENMNEERPVIVISAAADARIDPNDPNDPQDPEDVNPRGVYVIHLTQDLMTEFANGNEDPLDVDNWACIRIYGEVYQKLDENGDPEWHDSPTNSVPRVAGDRLGYNVANVGDVNGDGYVDFCAGADRANGNMIGRAYVYFMPTTIPNIYASSPDPDIVYDLRENPDPPLSYTSPDPPLPYVKIQLPEHGTGNLVDLNGASTASGTLYQFTANSTHVDSNFGEQVSPAGNFNGDTLDVMSEDMPLHDVLIGSPNWVQPWPEKSKVENPTESGETPQQTGAAYVIGFRESDPGTSGLDELFVYHLFIDIEDDPNIVVGLDDIAGGTDFGGEHPEDGQLFGKDLYCAGDVVGDDTTGADGLSDVMIGAKNYGAIFVIPDPPGPPTFPDQHLASLRGRIYVFGGFSGDPGDFVAEDQLALIFDGCPTCTTDVEYNAINYWKFGASLDMLEDIDGDGRTEIAFGATAANFGSVGQGGAWVYLSTEIGTGPNGVGPELPRNGLTATDLNNSIVTAEPTLEIQGTTARSTLGKHMRHAFITEDCYQDLVIGLFRWNDPAFDPTPVMFGGPPTQGRADGAAIVVDVRAAIYPCIADIDGDGSVGSSDLSILIGAWNEEGPNRADVTGDCVVNSADTAELVSSWGPCN